MALSVNDLLSPDDAPPTNHNPERLTNQTSQHSISSNSTHSLAHLYDSMNNHSQHLVCPPLYPQSFHNVNNRSHNFADYISAHSSTRESINSAPIYPSDSRSNISSPLILDNTAPRFQHQHHAVVPYTIDTNALSQPKGIDYTPVSTIPSHYTPMHQIPWSAPPFANQYIAHQHSAVSHTSHPSPVSQSHHIATTHHYHHITINTAQRNSVTSPIQQQPNQARSTSEPNTPKPKTKPRRRKSTKDPDAPKHPMSPFLFYLKQVRPQYTAKYPGSSIVPISGMISAAWKALSPAEKSIYEQLTKEDKARYAREMELYLSRKHADQISRAKEMMASKKLKENGPSTLTK